jgi:Na+/H+ antiporter NhaC
MVKGSKNIHHLMGWCGVMCLAGNAALADEAAQVATLSPVLRDIVDKNVEATPEQNYTLRLRLATFTSAMGIYGSQLIPWHVYLGFYVGIAAAVYPVVSITQVDIIKYNFMAMIAVATLIILTFTGLDRFIPLFAMPKEPEEVQLKKNM